MRPLGLDKPGPKIGHVLFLDLIGAWEMTINEQTESLEILNAVVRETQQFRSALRAGRLTRSPFEHGMALVFRDNPEAPIDCALQITEAMRQYPQVELRMSIHSGPVRDIRDANETHAITFDGVEMAQRLKDCAESGQILLSKNTADELAEGSRWRPFLHELGEFEVEPGVSIAVARLDTEAVADLDAPIMLKPAQATSQTRASPRPWFASGVSWKVAAGALVIAASAAALIALLPLRTRHGTKSPPAAAPADSSRIAVAPSDAPGTNELPQTSMVTLGEPTSERSTANSWSVNPEPPPNSVAVVSVDQVLPPGEGPEPSERVINRMEGERFPQTRTRSLTMEDLRGWDVGRLRYAINELYARGGYDFRDPQVRSLFSKLAWYQQRRVRGRTEYDAIAHLSAAERHNLTLLRTIRDQQRR